MKFHHPLRQLFMVGPKHDVAVYGPFGHQVMETEKEARKRAERPG